MSTIPLSVILPAYNAQRYLAESVDSVLAQTFVDFELIVIDDGSTDRTPGLLHDYAMKDSRVRVISRANTGIVGALNDGLKTANGKFIARMDADDICMPDRFDKQLNYLNDHPEIDCVGSRVIVIDPYGLEMFVSDHPLGHDEIDSGILGGNGWMMVHPAAMFRREILDKLGGYRQEFNFLEDVDLFLRLAEIGRLANLPDPLLKYRQHPQSVTKTRPELQTRLWTQCLRQTYARRGLSLPDNWTYVPNPLPDPPQQLRSWAWKALKLGNTRIARHHALAAWRSDPINKESWRVLLCALRGR